MENHISILGICCARDVFGMQSEDGGYIIDRFVQSINPVALQMGSMLLDKKGGLPESIFEGKTNFYRRNITLDLNKNVFDYMSEVKSDWLVIDAGAFRKSIFFTPDMQKASTSIFPETATLLKKDGYIYDYGENRGDIFDLPEELVSKKIDEYVDNVLKLCPQKRIVLIEFYDIVYYYDSKKGSMTMKEGKGHSFCDKENGLMSFGFKELKKRIPHAHIIYFPCNVIGDVLHKWGMAPLHYVQEYYKYAFQCFKVIEKGLDQDKEEHELLKLKHETEQLLHMKYGTILNNYLDQKEKEHNTLLRFKSYEQIFKNMLIGDGKGKIKEFICKNGIKNVGIYGLSEIGKVFIEYFLEWDINISFIVENHSADSTYKSINMYQRGTTTFEAVDAMIICDLNYERVISFLEKNNYSEKYYNYYEIIK